MKATREEKSGYKEDDYVNDAVAMYCNEHEMDGDEFPFMKCWEYLRQFDKFQSAGIFKKPNTRKKTISSWRRAPIALEFCSMLKKLARTR